MGWHTRVWRPTLTIAPGCQNKPRTSGSKRPPCPVSHADVSHEAPRDAAWQRVWQGLHPRELIWQEWAAYLCQDYRRSRSQFVADLRGLKMGSSVIKPLVPCFRIVMLGLDNSGKTTILYRIKQNIFSQQRSTVGFNCETVGALQVCLF